MRVTLWVLSAIPCKAARRRTSMVRPVRPSDSSSRYSTNLLSIVADERLMRRSARYPATNRRKLLGFCPNRQLKLLEAAGNLRVRAHHMQRVMGTCRDDGDAHQ